MFCYLYYHYGSWWYKCALHHQQLYNLCDYYCHRPLEPRVCYFIHFQPLQWYFGPSLGGWSGMALAISESTGSIASVTAGARPRGDSCGSPRDVGIQSVLRKISWQTGGGVFTLKERARAGSAVVVNLHLCSKDSPYLPTRPLFGHTGGCSYSK